MREDVYTVQCGQPVPHRPSGRCPAQLNVIARNEKEARERIRLAGRALGWRLGNVGRSRCATHLVGGAFTGTWIEIGV